MRNGITLRQALEDDIAEGRFLPGEKLDENGLARRFEVSRTPIREALQQLSAVGLVELRPRRSAVVSRPGIRQVIEMFEAMAEIESACGRLAARRLTAEDAVALRAAHLACSAAAMAENSDLYFEENNVFHGCIYLASHNSFLADQAFILQRRLAPLRRMQLRSFNRMRSSLHEHGQVVDAILAQDGERAAARLRDHIVIQGERFTDVAAALDQRVAAD